MSNKLKKTNYDIDYVNMTVNGELQKLQPLSHSSEPKLAKMWVANINPRDSAVLLKVIRDNLNEDPLDIRHLKRVQKKESEEGPYLSVLLCSCDYLSSKTDLLKIFSPTVSHIRIEEATIAVNRPFDKDLNIKWSENYWPIVWKGNPLVQEMNQSCVELNLETAQKHFDYINKLSRTTETKDDLPIYTIFVDPETNEIMATSQDKRTSKDLLCHSIMECIQQIADKEVHRRKLDPTATRETNNYLCLNYHVYTTHEPCTMCSMALIHSRISKLFYIHDSPITGSINPTSGCGYSIHVSCSLNWKYEAWKALKTDQYVANSIDSYVDI